MQSPIMHGARAKVQIQVGNSGPLVTVGVFTSCTYSFGYDTHVAHILGRHGPVSVTYTGMDAVRLTLTGFRIINNSPFKIGTMPQLKDLMSYPGLSIQIEDRKTGALLARVEECFPDSFGSGNNARSVSDVTVTMLGKRFGNEDTDSIAMPEAPGATDFSGSNGVTIIPDDQ